ncbi:Rpp14/Pop5 family-domain-containing protein [Tricladium varicosporioides]|nr:Rpp14/Pop5 family-domain-containing protein [Hymenoscyphus varicosporioides]
MVRLKNRYLLVNILYPEIDDAQSKSIVPDLIAINQPTTNALTQHTLLKHLRLQISELFGDYGSGAVSDNLQVKYLSNATSTFILRVSRAQYQLVWAALSMMNNVPTKDGKKCVYRVVKVSGTVRKVEEEAIRRAKEMIVKARRELGEQSESTLDSIFDKGDKQNEGSSTRDVMVVDGGDSEDEMDIYNDDG